ncbi:MAG: IS66 family transposase [Bradymonadaceae bacterium]
MEIDIDSEEDIERLREVAKLQQRELEQMTQRLAELSRQLAEATGQEAADLQEELDALEDELDKHRTARFGQSSERRGRPEGEEEEASSEAGTSGDEQPQSGHGPTAQPDLDVVEELHELAQPDRTCPKCGGDLEPIDGQVEETEEVDVVERRYVLKKHKKQKYRCECDDHIEAALGPEKLIDGGRYSIDVAVDTAVQKYADHIPLARQTKVASRQGLDVKSQTLWDQVQALAEELAPSLKATRQTVQDVGVIGADETSWPMMEAGESREIWLWAARSRRGVSFRFDESRSGQAAAKLLDEFTGTVLCDGYSAYRRLKNTRNQGELEEPRAGPGPIELAGCMSHARRKFYRAENSDSQAGAFLDRIAQLYAVEDELVREEDESDQAFFERRRQRREADSRPILDEIRRLLDTTEALPSSKLGSAIQYMDNHWEELTRFIEDGRLPIDNNATERSIRQPVVGRKNYYGCRTEAGLEVAETMYTLIETCRIIGVDPHDYLKQAALRSIRNTNQREMLPHELLDRD